MRDPPEMIENGAVILNTRPRAFENDVEPTFDDLPGYLKKREPLR
jgi:hypothetical protein